MQILMVTTETGMGQMSEALAAGANEYIMKPFTPDMVIRQIGPGGFMSGVSGKIRVLVVDDSVVMRRLLSEVISSDPELEVAGYAANGQIALALLDQVSPDIITLDVEMPIMDGLATLKAMRSAQRMLPIIMFSTLTERGAAATIDSLTLGASDYVAKPTGAGNYNGARERIREALVPRIKASMPPIGGYSSRRTHSQSSSLDGAVQAAESNRGGGYRIFDRRSECVGSGAARHSGRFSSAIVNCAAHASNLHSFPGSAPGRSVPVSGGGGGGG